MRRALRLVRSGPVWTRTCHELPRARVSPSRRLVKVSPAAWCLVRCRCFVSASCPVVRSTPAPPLLDGPATSHVAGNDNPVGCDAAPERRMAPRVGSPRASKGRFLRGLLCYLLLRIPVGNRRVPAVRRRPPCCACHARRTRGWREQAGGRGANKPPFFS